MNGWFPPSTTIYAIEAFGLGRLVAAGSFANANGDPLADNIALIDARTRRWGPLGSNGAGNGPFNGNVLALATFGLTIGTNHLFAGGNFTNVGGDPQASYVASYPIPRG